MKKACPNNTFKAIVKLYLRIKKLVLYKKNLLLYYIHLFINNMSEQMKITSSKNAILAFAPIGFLDDKDKAQKKLREENRHSAMEESVLKRITESQNQYDNVSLNKNVNKSASVCFGGFFNVNKICQSNALKKGLEFASDNGALFAASVAFVTGALLRPIAIFATPGVKKENKECASAQSISSSLIGLGLMALVSTPIAHAIKKINANPQKYLKETTIKNLSLGGDLLKSKKYNFATQLFKLGTDFACAIPKALLTCALIPPIIAQLFPQKNSCKKTVYPGSMICFKSNFNYPNSQQIFKGFIKEGQVNEHFSNK